MSPLTLAFLAVWVFLVVAQAGLLPWTRYAWSMNLWAYFPTWVSWGLALLSLAACFPGVRARGLSAAGFLGQRAAHLPRPARDGLAFLLAFTLLWIFRERQLFGDSGLLMVWAKHSGEVFVFPDIGATLVLWLAAEIGSATGIWAEDIVRVCSCAFGGLTLILLMRCAPYLASPTPGGAGPGRTGILVCLILSGGIARVFAGHIEVYPPLLAAVVAYLWLALAFLQGRATWLAPCLALGVAGWVHAASVLLVPSLVALPFLVPTRPSRREGLRRVAIGLALTGLPLLTFGLLLMIVGETESLLVAWRKALQVLGQDPDPEATRWWVRSWGGYPSIGTDVVFLSPAHLKYLANAFHLLSPFAVPVLVGCALAAPATLLAGGATRFLLVATAPLVAYTCLLRPFWGPYDWDLFSVAALCCAALASHLLTTRVRFKELAGGLLAFQLLFVGGPFLALAPGATRDAGPFTKGSFEFNLMLPRTEPPEKIAPWL